ncbi:hypothetical protein FA95DRAFT_1575993 [Auriscalpium vulgare]|uniref:Uncharacterized protein n=1 Tax=Auriscalpium vulgare TaxID=40419 RepID=A0ACB8REK3_9AGAM|nr:hypothetical protein FA95DRAFT_1575993 [Auriscalpium vulgare]
MHSSPAATTRGTPSRRGRSPRASLDNAPALGPATPLARTRPSPAVPNPAATFTSCLSIPVEGAQPVPRARSPAASASASAAAAAPAAPADADGPAARRAPRKSKMDALAALQSHAGEDDEDSPEPGAVEAPQGALYPPDAEPIAVAAKLDMRSVKTSSPRHMPSAGTAGRGARPFGLEDCPTFHPTAEEFKDPMAYIKTISETAKNYGICKIVPPESWEMPFVTDTENFRFTTRLQRLNSIEASSRAKINFLEQLYRFHQQQGNTRVSVPTINNKPMDLWLLRKEVQKLGGHEAVTKAKKWADLGRLLGYGGIPGLSTQIKNSYTRVILPYEHYCEMVRSSPALANLASASRDPQLKTHVNMQTLGKRPWVANNGNGSADNAGDVDMDSPPSSPLTATSSPLSEPPDDTEVKEEPSARAEGSTRRRGLRAASAEQNTRQWPPVGKKSAANRVATKPADRDAEEESSEVGALRFHMFCLALTSVPKGQWYCPTCIFGTGGDFGFDEGQEHSLSSFQARDKEFRRLWFQAHPPPQGTASAADPTVNKFGDVLVSEYDVENEFWRLVQSQHDTVEIEYGADVHSTTHRRYIKSDISGMTVPWTYVGMVFSTFCWHNEDHYTYSVNYMHWGETKTWYGIPGEDAEKFEAAIKREAPDLFEAQPDLLFQLVTLMNPKRLTDAGVRVYACNQRAGELVITYPKAYHAGFNHGLNFNEAVNFALPEWLPFGRQCVQRYREHRKLPVFSHDELLITITQQSQSIATAIWLNESLKEMTEREMESRRKARALKLGELLEEEDRADDQTQCNVCKVFCYLSQVTCHCTTKVVCVDHAHLLCKDPMEQHTLRKRFSDDELLDTQAKIAERATVPTAWQAKLTRTLAESARPPLRSLRALLAEGDRINHPLPELLIIRKCVARANEWLDAANTFIVRKQSRKRSRRSRGRPSPNEPPLAIEDPGERPDKDLDELYALIRQVDDLGFDCPEIAILKTHAAKAEELKLRARVLLGATPADRDREAYLADCDRLLVEGSSINVYLDELIEVEKLVSREQLIHELDDADDSVMTLEEVSQYLTRARQCNLPHDNKHVKQLEGRQRAGQSWDERARHVLSQPYKTIEELEEFANIESSVPIDPTLLDRIATLRTKARDFDKQARVWLSVGPNDPRPRIQDAMRVVTRAEKDFSILTIRELKRMADFASDLESRCDQVLKNRYEHQEDEDIFETMLKWVDYAKKYLGIFDLPKFQKLDSELTQHFRWLETLPWYCPNHRIPHGKELLEDVIDSTKPEDDMPPDDEFFTCICNEAVRPPVPGAVSDAVQCDHCSARFHGQCARNGGSCPFCDHHHWNGSIHKERSWHFCFMPAMLVYAPEVTRNHSDDWRQLEVIVHRVDRLASVIGQFLSFASQPGNQRKEYMPQVRHYMRKLYRIQFAVSPNQEVSFGLDLAGLHRILAEQPAPYRAKKRRRPKFTFGQDVDQDWADGTRCICRGRTPYLLNYPTVVCENCTKRYHGSCVFFPPMDPSYDNRYLCPLCCLRKNKRYEYAELRVKDINNADQDTYVDTMKMLDTFSKDLIYKKLPPPYTQTLFVELIRWTAGQPDTIPNGATHPSTSSPGAHHNGPAPHARAHQGLAVPPPPAPAPSWETPRHAPVAGHHMPPPPPWATKWTNGGSGPASASSSAPPSRGHPVDGRYSPLTPPRKRKYADGEPPLEPAYNSPGSYDGTRGKRRTLSHTPGPEPVPANALHRGMQMQTQTLSPSLAMIMSPDTRNSPRQPYGGPSGSTAVPVIATTRPSVPSNGVALPSTPPQRKMKVDVRDGSR